MISVIIIYFHLMVHIFIMLFLILTELAPLRENLPGLDLVEVQHLTKFPKIYLKSQKLPITLSSVGGKPIGVVYAIAYYLAYC